MAIFREGLEG